MRRWSWRAVAPVLACAQLVACSYAIVLPQAYIVLQIGDSSQIRELHEVIDSFAATNKMHRGSFESITKLDRKEEAPRSSVAESHRGMHYYQTHRAFQTEFAFSAEAVSVKCVIIAFNDTEPEWTRKSMDGYATLHKALHAVNEKYRVELR